LFKRFQNSRLNCRRVRPETAVRVLDFGEPAPLPWKIPDQVLPHLENYPGSGLRNHSAKRHEPPRRRHLESLH
jgi:hypothetical protein